MVVGVGSWVRWLVRGGAACSGTEPWHEGDALMSYSDALPCPLSCAMHAVVFCPVVVPSNALHPTAMRAF
eukprot:scaffold192107_cov14-Tisochrysis_lutea.AAC.1